MWPLSFFSQISGSFPSPQSACQELAPGRDEPRPPIQRDRSAVVPLDLEVERADALPSDIGHGFAQELAADPLASPFGGHDDLVDEGVASSVLEAVAERHDRIACDLPVEGRDPGAAPGGATKKRAEDPGGAAAFV